MLTGIISVSLEETLIFFQKAYHTAYFVAIAKINPRPQRMTFTFNQIKPASIPKVYELLFKIRIKM